MSTELHNTGRTGAEEPKNSDVAYESADINTRTILAYLLYLTIAVVAAFIASVFIFKATTSFVADQGRVPPPSHRGVTDALPPEPRLQGIPGHTNDPQQDLRNMVQDDRDANDQLAWVDKSAGIAQIPVDEAMKIIVTKGLPAVPAPAGEKKK
jgi:hypothetical protein